MIEINLSVYSEQVRFAWHDAVCPESFECRSRNMHALTTTSTEPVLERFLERLGVTVVAR